MQVELAPGGFEETGTPGGQDDTSMLSRSAFRIDGLVGRPSDPRSGGRARRPRPSGPASPALPTTIQTSVSWPAAPLVDGDARENYGPTDEREGGDDRRAKPSMAIEIPSARRFLRRSTAAATSCTRTVSVISSVRPAGSSPRLKRRGDVGVDVAIEKLQPGRLTLTHGRPARGLSRHCGACRGPRGEPTAPQLDDQADLLRERDELERHHQPAPRMRPTQERLESDTTRPIASSTIGW